jgi:hypothetical protein
VPREVGVLERVRLVEMEVIHGLTIQVVLRLRFVPKEVEVEVLVLLTLVGLEELLHLVLD